MSASATGDLVGRSPSLTTLILYQLSLELDAEVRNQNHSTSYSTVPVWEKEMREIKDLASGMKQTIANLKQATLNAKSGLDAEIKHAHTNAQKVQAFTQELKEANAEVEDFLGETGSNFPTSEDSHTPAPHLDGPDKNGVSVLKK